MLRADEDSTTKKKTKMKTTTLKADAAIGLSALFVGSAAAQDTSSVSDPVGYETLDLVTGFNYIGLRLHEAPVASGAVVSVAGAGETATITFADGIADQLVDGQTFIVEVTSGDAIGATVIVDSFDVDADTVTVLADISGDLVAADSVTIRPSADLVSVFGDGEAVGLTSAPGFGDSDQVWVPDGSGGYAKYFYGEGGGFGAVEGWKDSEGNLIDDPTAVDLVYTDGIILFSQGDNSIVVSGSVKLTESSYVLTTQFNLLSSVYPVGATLVSLFGEDAVVSAGLVSAPGFGDSDQVWIPSATGFDKYYYGQGGGFGAIEGWKDSDGNNLDDPNTAEIETVDIPSGFFLVRNGDNDRQILGTQPLFYDSL